MKAKNIMKLNQLKRSIKNNGLAWIIFGLLLVSDWEFALLFWIIPIVLLISLEYMAFGKIKHGWELILTPIINFYFISGVIWEWLNGKVKN